MPSRVCPDRRCVNYRNPATRPDPPQPPASFRSAAMQAFQLYRRLARHGELSRAVLYPKLFPKQHKCGALLEASTERGLFLAFERGVEDILAGCPFVTVVPPRSSRWTLPARHLQRLPKRRQNLGCPGRFQRHRNYYIVQSLARSALDPEEGRRSTVPYRRRGKSACCVLAANV
jgi:hypothetical protein